MLDGTAEELPTDDSTFDVAIASLLLCSVRDQSRALAEIHRVLRPGGEIWFYEHTIAANPRLARVQRIADRMFWPRVAGGCHASRDTIGALESAGFAISEARHFNFRPCVVALLTSPHAIGRATRTL